MNLEDMIAKLEEDIKRETIITHFIASLHTIEKERLRSDKELLKVKQEELIKKLEKEK